MFIKGMIKDCYLAKLPKIADNTYNVSITGNTDDLVLYTVDGTDPIINGKVYNAPFKVDKDCIVEARAVNQWSYSSSAFADVKKSKTEIKPLTSRYKDMRGKGAENSFLLSPFYYQYEDGRDEWTLFLCIGYCISLNANLYTATYTTASGNTEGFKISVKNGDLYFDVYREGVIDESIVLAKNFGVEDNYHLDHPVSIQYLIINSNGQINGKQKFKPIVANGEPTLPNLSFASVGDTDLLFGIYDYCIYSGIKEDLEDFKITENSIGKVELYVNDDNYYIQARGRGNIYITDQPISEYVGVKPSEGYLYTGYDYGKHSVSNYSATAYAGLFPVVLSTTRKTIYHTVILRQDINASNIEDGEKVFALEDDKTIFLHFKRFVPNSSGSEVILFQITDEYDNITHEIVLNTDTGFKIKHNGEYEILKQFDSTLISNYLIAINKNTLSMEIQKKDDVFDGLLASLSDVPSNPKIKISSPAVSMPSDWEIGRIAVSDNGDLLSNIDYQVLYGPFYD